jgi:hypothetical protein
MGTIQKRGSGDGAAFDRVRNVVVELRKVAKGAEFQAEVEGGWSRKVSPFAGYLLSDRAGRTMFLSAVLMQGLLKGKVRCR